jgi:hypothetical protein
MTLLHAVSVELKSMVMAGHYYYSNREYVDMITALGACNGNAHAVAMLHAERLPRWHHPNDKIYQTYVEQWLVDTGHLNTQCGLGGHPLQMLWREEGQVLDTVADQPDISMRA